MADITKCKGKDCKLKNKCYRYIAKKGKYQSWYEPTFKGNKCVVFWEVREKI